MERPPGSIVWIHACSVGEVKSSYNLIKNTLKNNELVLVTTSTYLSGLDVKKSFAEKVIHQYLPLDLTFFVKRFLKKWKPCKAIFIESEIWPNLIFATKKLNIPLCLIQARFSNNSMKKWKIFSKFFKDILRCFNFIVAQSEEEKIKLSKFTDVNKITVANLKYSTEKLKFSSKEKKIIQKSILKKKVISALSTHSGEEKIIIDEIKKIKKNKDFLFIIQPRHPKRSKEIINIIKKHNIPYKQRSKGELPSGNTNIYLFDTFGESGLLISISDLIIMGGTLIPIGGHNLLEPAKFEKNIIVGPYIYKINEIVHDFKTKNAIVCLNSINDLNIYIKKITANRNYSKNLSLNVKKLLSNHYGEESVVYKKIEYLK
tara:strand:+ start:35 stop:1153 length:1119 start_codon:yes stop_codon:yes gene_type:complete